MTPSTMPSSTICLRSAEDRCAIKKGPSGSVEAAKKDADELDGFKLKVKYWPLWTNVTANIRCGRKSRFVELSKVTIGNVLHEVFSL